MDRYDVLIGKKIKPQAGVRVYVFTHSGTGDDAAYTNYARHYAPGMGRFPRPVAGTG